jgi:thioredoxin 2
MPNNPVLVRCKSCRTLNRVPYDKLPANPVCGQCKTPLEVPRYPLNVTTTSYEQQVKDWPGLLLAEFWAKWCGYCRKIEPFMNELASKRAGSLKIIRVDVDAEPVLASRFTIKATPTFILYRNGRQIGRLDGAPAHDAELVQWIDQTMLRSAPAG